jgi:hypothetical protein
MNSIFFLFRITKVRSGRNWEGVLTFILKSMPPEHALTSLDCWALALLGYQAKLVSLGNKAYIPIWVLV